MYCHAQGECYLGLGGSHDDKIVSVFKLSADQRENLKNWSAELKLRNEIFKVRAKRLLQNHPQKSSKDLVRLSTAYKELLDSIRGNLLMVDKRMLATFNDAQYGLYVKMCALLVMNPIYANRQTKIKK